MKRRRAGRPEKLRRRAFPSNPHVISNETRAFFMAITGSGFRFGPRGRFPQTRRYYRQPDAISAALAYAADISMLSLGGTLKRRERVSARLGDVLSMLYLASATLKRFEDEGRQEADLPFSSLVASGALARGPKRSTRVRELFRRDSWARSCAS